MREELLARWVLDQVMSHYSIVNGTGVGITKVSFVNFSVSKIFDLAKVPRCDMAFIEPMHCNKPNITYLLTC